MKPHRLFPSLLAAALALALFATAHAAEDNTTTVKFSDPSKPGTLKLQLGRGDIRIKGASVAEVSVKSDAKAITNRPRKDGLRVIAASTGFGIAEKDNVITVESDMFRGGGGSDFSITVPRNTNIVINNMWGGGDIRLADIDGDIEVECPHGEVFLDRISGGALVTTMNGEIHASVLKVTANKPLSFASMNGEVQVRLPGDAKANLLIRTQNGTILTDFDENALITKAESTPRTKATTFRGRTVLSPEVQEKIAEASRMAAEYTKLAEQAAREATDAVRAGADRARTDKLRAEADARRAEAEAKRAEVEAKRTEAEGRVADVRPPKPPEAPRAVGAAPAVPAPAAAPEPGRTIKSKIMPTGGNLVTGTLNGGGPEISIATMNGDVKVQKLEAK